MLILMLILKKNVRSKKREKETGDRIQMETNNLTRKLVLDRAFIVDLKNQLIQK